MSEKVCQLNGECHYFQQGSFAAYNFQLDVNATEECRKIYRLAWRSEEQMALNELTVITYERTDKLICRSRLAPKNNNKGIY